MHELCTEGLYNEDVNTETKWRTVEDVCQYIGSVIEPEPLCVETGSTYFYLKEVMEHHTTNNIVKHIAQPHKGILFSLDEDPQIDVLNQLMRDNNLEFKYLSIVVGDSVGSIKSVISYLDRTVDVLCLDSAEDPDHMVNEYQATRLSDKHFVLVDDIHNPGSVKYLKMVPMLKEMGYTWIQVPTPTGMLVAAKGYDIPGGKTIG